MSPLLFYAGAHSFATLMTFNGCKHTLHANLYGSDRKTADVAYALLVLCQPPHLCLQHFVWSSTSKIGPKPYMVTMSKTCKDTYHRQP